MNSAEEIYNGIACYFEVENDHLRSVLVQPRDIAEGKKGLLVSTAAGELASCHVYIITVPTLTDKHNRPVLTPMLKASETVGIQIAL